ncbi:fibrinogen-like protein 1 [Haliotis cracherodii]|uniref:fibrinogen-like protein 1 n=1 Tax=Haliotis cracherodii TaxID=6455 RepID=UPI0039E89461
MREGIPFQNGLYFMGLEPLHLLTKQGTYDMRVFLGIYYQGYILIGFVWYRNIRVDSEADGYALHWDYFEKEQSYNSSIYLDGFGGLGDATKNLNGAHFGTYDRDVSGCARAQSRGWWYNKFGCTTLKFVHNGVMWPTNQTGTITLEFFNYFYLRIQSVAYYREDDLVL